MNLALDDKAAGYLETDEEIARDKDPLADIKAAWLMAGEDIKDFTVLKFNQKLREEEKRDFNKNFISGNTDYEEKIDLLNRMRRHSTSWKDVKKNTLSAAKVMGKELGTVGRVLGKVVEPGFSRRERRRNLHLKRIENHELKSLAITRQRLQIERDREALRFRKAGLERSRGRVLDHLKPSEDLKMALARVAATRKRELELKSYREKTQTLMEEKAAAASSSSSAAAIDHRETMKARRTFRATHYTQVAKDARMEANVRRKNADRTFLKRDAELAARGASIEDQTRLARSLEQVKGPELTPATTFPSGRTLGVFGGGGVVIPAHQGGAKTTEGEVMPGAITDHQSAADHGRIQIFQGTPTPHVEEEWERLGDLEGHRGQADAEASAREQDCANLETAAASLDAQKGRLCAERRQLAAEDEVLRRRIAGPPRRDANETEKEARARRSDRLRHLHRKESKLAHEASTLRARAEAHRKGGAAARAKAAALEEKCNRARKPLEDKKTDAGLGAPPMILGRSLSKVPTLGLNPLEVAPAEALKAITRHSTLEVYRHQSKGVLQVRDAATRLERGIWAAEQHRVNETAHLDEMIAKLANIATRVKKSRSDQARQDLVQAIQIFHAKGTTLKSVNTRHEGPLDWWARRKRTLHTVQWVSSDMQADEDATPLADVAMTAEELLDADGETKAQRWDPQRQGFAHDGARTGFLEGEMALPKFDAYTIEFVITKRFPSAENLGDSTDRCTVKMGPNLRNLQEVAVVRNVIDEYAGSARYELQHIMRTDTLAWRFEFMSSTEDPNSHFVVEQGAYAPRNVPDLEVTDGTNRVLSSYIKSLKLELASGSMKYSKWLAELIKADSVPPVPTDDEDKRRLMAKAAKFGQAPPGFWDSESLHATPQRHHIGTFRRLLRDELMEVADTAAQEDVEKGFAAESGTRRKRSSRVASQTPLKPPTQEELLTQKKEESQSRRVRNSLKKYLKRKRQALQPKIDKAKKCAGCGLEIFDEENNKWLHMRVERVDVKWLEGGVACNIRYEVTPVDDMERVCGSAEWINLEDVRHYVSQRQPPDPDTRRIWETNEANAAIADARAYLALVDVENRRKKREAKEKINTQKFDQAKKDAVRRKRKETYAEAAGLMTTRAVKTLTKAKAKHVVEEMRAGLTPISFFIKKPGPPPLEEDATPENSPVKGAHGNFDRPGTAGSERPSSRGSNKSDEGEDALTPMRERLKATPFWKLKERKLLKKQIDSMTQLGSQAAIDLEKKRLKEEKRLKALEKKAGLNKKMTDDEMRELLRPAPLIPLSKADIQKKARILMLQKSAHAEAEQRWMDEYVNAVVGAEERQWRQAGEQRLRDVDAMRKADEDAVKKQRFEARAREKKEEKAKALLRSQRRAHMREKIGVIPNFEKAIRCFEGPPSSFCQHVRAKAWGGKYGKGVRCLDCGKEMTATHLEEAQQHGIGGGDDPDLCRRVARHRLNRAAYRAETLDMATEVQAIEKERARLEKEEWHVRNADVHFYDFDDMKAVYQLDRRHQGVLKREGLQRQGVQWSDREVEERVQAIERGDFLEKPDDTHVALKSEAKVGAGSPEARSTRNFAQEQEDALKSIDYELSPRSKKQALADAAAFRLSARPPPARLHKLRHRAAFHDMLQLVGRVNAYRQRLEDLKAQKLRLDREKREFDDCLSFLHREIFTGETHLKTIEKDLIGAARVLQVKRVSDQQFGNALEVLKAAKIDKKTSDLKLCGLADSAEDAEKLSAQLGTATRDLLRQRVKQERSLQVIAERASINRAKADAKSLVLKEKALIMASMHYRSRGVIVPTKYGHSPILLFRDEDQIAIVELKFGKPRARAYIPLQGIMQTERAIAAANLVAMTDEELLSRAFYVEEKRGCSNETQLMGEDERDYKAKLKLDASLKKELVEVDRKVKAAVQWALGILGTARGKVGIAKRSAKATEKEAHRMEIAARTWGGEGTKPVPLTTWQKSKYFASRMRRLRREFVLEAASLAEHDARRAIDAKNAALTSEHALEFLYFDFLKEFLVEHASDSLESGLQAKSRTEDETGVVFLHPPHMQHAVYTILSRWWTQRKKDLKKQLETWGATSKQDEMRREEERARRLSLVKDDETKGNVEREVRRQQALARALHAEEVRSRAYYAFELAACLSERRSMKNNEQETKAYLHTLKTESKGSKYDIDGEEPAAKSTKQQRRDAIKKDQGRKITQDRELKGMREEDALGMELRMAEKKAIQLAALKQEMELYELDNDIEVEELVEDLSDDEGYASSVLSDDSQAGVQEARAPPAQESFEQARERMKAERLDRRRYRAKRRKEKRQALLRKKRETAELEALAVLEAFRKGAMIEHARAELEWMELEEEARTVEKQVKTASANLRKVALYCQGKGMEELTARSKAIYFRRECARRTVERDDATQWLETCSEEEKVKRKVKVRVDRDTRCMDTRAVAGVYQRFVTPLLHQELHTHYFRTLAKIITNRAELIATERRQMLLFEMSRRNEAATKVRERDLQKTWRKRTRQELMRLFRSELGKKMFGRSQRQVLSDVFKGWVRYWYWHRGHKDAFELKYAIIKHGVDLRRLHPKILGAALKGKPTRDDDVPTLEGFDRIVEAKPLLIEETPPSPEEEVDEWASDENESPSTKKKKENRREYFMEQAEDEARKQRKIKADEALYGPRFTEIMDGNRRIAKDRQADRERGGLAHEVGGKPVECYAISPRNVPDLKALRAQRGMSAPPVEEPKRNKFRKTFNERLRERAIICRTCGQSYTEGHNSALSCGYHPGAWRTACPISCPAHKDVTKITAKCMAHRRKRWSCCDSISESSGNGTGCKYRYHRPPEKEPRYGDVATKLLEAVRFAESTIDQDIRDARENSTVRHAMKLNRDQLSLAADKQAKERKIVSKFNEMKCDRHMDEHVLVSALQEYEGEKIEEEKQRMAQQSGHEYRGKDLIKYEKVEDLESLPDLLNPKDLADLLADEASSAMESSLMSPPPTPLATPSTSAPGWTPSTSAPSTFRKLEDGAASSRASSGRRSGRFGRS